MDKGEEKQIQHWQEKVRTDFGDASRLYKYLFETLDNFYYRYLETSLNQNLKTSELAPGVWGAESFESDMLEALKVKHLASKTVVIELAKKIPKAQGPKVRYTLQARVIELTSDRGRLVLEAEVLGLEATKKEVTLKYQDLAQFRKELALKLEEVCEIFL